jgi:hypothetical protein
MQEDQYSAEETEQRLKKILKGAFNGSPTPLKDIPTRASLEMLARAIGAMSTDVAVSMRSTTRLTCAAI